MTASRDPAPAVAVTSHRPSTPAAGSLCVGVTVVTWACAFPAIRVGLRSFGAPELGLARLGIASAMLLVMSVVARPPTPPRRLWGRVALCGLLGQALYQLLNMLGETRVPAGTASILIATAPLFSILAAIVLLGESARGRWPGMLLALAGAALVGLSGRTGGGLYVLVVLGAAVCQGLYHVLVKPLSEAIGAFASAAWSLWAGTVFALPAMPWLIGDVRTASAASFGAVAFLGVIPSAVGYATWSVALARAPIAHTTSALYLVPVAALGASWVWLGERPPSLALVGGAIAIAGVVLVRRGGADATRATAGGVPRLRAVDALRCWPPRGRGARACVAALRGSRSERRWRRRLGDRER
jgi:drug/metabolite transporter (DMT)-like permease